MSTPNDVLSQIPANPRTLAEKVWDDHLVVKGENGEPDLIYIDLHLVHEVTSPQAFDGLRAENRPLRRVDLTIATEDHNTPTLEIDRPIADPTSRIQIETLRHNAAEFGVRLHSLGDKEQGIVHVVGPQLGLTMPGITVVCGDSHTSTHGAFGAMAFGIGTSEVEHVMATQTLPLKPFKTMAITVEGTLKPGVTAKDIILAIIAKIGTGGGQGYVLEFRGSAIRALSVEGRMTVCNMAIEAGARAGMVAPDQITFDYLEGRDHAPKGQEWGDAVEYWKTLPTDEGAVFDAEVFLDGGLRLRRRSAGLRDLHAQRRQRQPHRSSVEEIGGRLEPVAQAADALERQPGGFGLPQQLRNAGARQPHLRGEVLARVEIAVRQLAQQRETERSEH